jgi:predicted amidophosphoribosyltransferase
VLSAEFDYCTGCGGFVGEHCEGCRHRLNTKWSFCPQCGKTSGRTRGGHRAEPRLVDVTAHGELVGSGAKGRRPTARAS